MEEHERQDDREGNLVPVYSKPKNCSETSQILEALQKRRQSLHLQTTA